eukprot:m.178777 g.178777  ORF g.178777 m.178777 type:complete len:76 (-) comp13560_c1_seq13:981-1208(-)
MLMCLHLHVCVVLKIMDSMHVHETRHVFMQGYCVRIGLVNKSSNFMHIVYVDNDNEANAIVRLLFHSMYLHSWHV